MNVLNRPMRLLTLSLTMLILPACATTSPPSSSILASAVENAVKIERKTLCEITRPETLSPGAFDASPLEARMKMAKDVTKWADACAGLV